MTKWLALAGLLIFAISDPTQARVLVPLLALGGMLSVLCACAGSSKPTVYHGHGVTRQDTVFHEAGHVVVARHRGAARVSAFVDKNGNGATTASERGAMDRAVILAAGIEATRRFYLPNPPDSRHDEAMLAQVCRELGITPAQARRVARREVSQHGYEIRRVAQQLHRRGRLW